MKLIDLHNHTRYSYDGRDTARAIIENAINNGVSYIGITDHQFSLGANVHRYIKSISELKEEYKKDITVFCGMEIGTRPKPHDFPTEISELLDFCLFESLDDARAMDLHEFIEWHRLFKCKTGLAHTDIFKLCEKYSLDFLKLMKREDIFWEINISGNYVYYYDFITNRRKQEAVAESGIKISVGSDLHSVYDFNPIRLKQTNELVRKHGNPLPLGITD